MGSNFSFVEHGNPYLSFIYVGNFLTNWAAMNFSGNILHHHAASQPEDLTLSVTILLHSTWTVQQNLFQFLSKAFCILLPKAMLSMLSACFIFCKRNVVCFIYV
jgi:hypothetical protein